MRILRRDIIRAATVGTASPTLATNSGADVAQQDNRKTCRTTSTASQEINYTWSSNQTVNMVAVCRHNWTTSATLRVRLYSDTAMTTQIYDSTATTAFASAILPAPYDITLAKYRGLKTTVFYFTEQTTVRGMKLTIADASNPDGYMECARILAGQHFQPRRKPGQGVQLAFVSNSRVTRLDGGGRNGDQRGTWRTCSFQIPAVGDEDYDDWAAIAQFHDTVLWTFFDLFPGDTSAKGVLNRMCCGFDSLGPFDQQSPGLTRLPITLGEA